MINLIWDSTFKRKFKKLSKYQPDFKTQFWNQLEIFTDDPFDKRLKSHKLSGNLKGYWAFSINFSHRVVFRFTSENEVLLVDIGSHEDVY